MGYDRYCMIKLVAYSFIEGGWQCAALPRCDERIWSLMVGVDTGFRSMWPRCMPTFCNLKRGISKVGLAFVFVPTQALLLDLGKIATVKRMALLPNFRGFCCENWDSAGQMVCGAVSAHKSRPFSEQMLHRQPQCWPLRYKAVWEPPSYTHCKHHEWWTCRHSGPTRARLSQT